MPAIITHDFFGRDVYDALFQTIGGSRDEADAFLLGNQGPDPLFYAVADFRATAYHKLGNTMHSRKPAELLAALKDSLGVLDPEEKPLGRAYALGFLCHYALDSTVHPLVYCHEHALCDAGEPGLTRDDGSEVHGVIESELDEMVLFAKRGDTVADQLAWSIRMLYEHPALCAEMGAAGAERAKVFSVEHYYADFVRIVRDMTENGGAQ